MQANLNYPQTIELLGSDDNHTTEITSNHVTVITSAGSHDHSSSQVTLKNIVDYNWEHKFYHGQLVAVHMGGKYIAYGIKVHARPDNGMVRVANRDTHARALIKGLTGQAQDIAFAHVPHQIVLACIDEEGHLFIHKIEGMDNIVHTLLLHIVHTTSVPTSGVPCSPHRVIWCPYIPENDSEIDDEVSKLLVVTHGAKAEMYSFTTVIAHHGRGPVENSSITEGYLELEHTQVINDATFSPDGTAICTASSDGEVKFFQVYMHSTSDSKPRCLHQWVPHSGKGVTSIFFLDNHKTHNPEAQFWKFAITCCDNNSELKLWSCKSWTCLQTINFKPHPSKGQSSLTLKPCIDGSAGYLMLSDVYNRALYVLQVIKSTDDTNVYIKSISEFLLPCCILSFGVVDAGLRKYKNIGCQEDLYSMGMDEMNQNLDDNEDVLSLSSNGSMQHDSVAVVLRLYVVQPKSLQECHIIFKPTLMQNTPVLSSLSRDSLMFSEELSDISSTNSRSATKKGLMDPLLIPNNNQTLTDIISEQNDFHSLKQQPLIPVPTTPPHPMQINLMTPEAFSSSISNKEDEHVMSKMVGDLSLKSYDASVLEARLSASPKLLGNKGNLDEFLNLSGGNKLEINDPPLSTSSDNNIAYQNHRENLASGGSSPSREVQEIMNDSRTDMWPCPPIVKMESNVSVEDIKKTNNILEKMMGMLLKDRTVIVGMLSQQSEQINSLQEEVSGLRTAQSQIRMQGIEQTQAAKEAIDSASLRFHNKQIKILNEIDDKRSNRDLQLVDKIVDTITTLLNAQIVDKLAAVLTRDIQHCVVPSVISTLDSLKICMQQEMSQKLTATDVLLKENITKLVHSKSVIEVLGNTMLHAVQSGLATTLKENFNNSLVPAYERVTNQMFRQIQETFLQGTKEYMHTIETNIEKQRRLTDRSKDVQEKILLVAENLRANTDATANLHHRVSEAIAKSISNLEMSLTNKLSEQISEAFKKQSEEIETQVYTAVRSTTVTPAPPVVDIQTQQNQIKALVAQGQINAAFQHALMASDLSLVVYVCGHVNPAVIFEKSPCLLHQNVLLSLIQQLSADMSQHTELKHKYLEEAVMNLDLENPITMEHVPAVLRDLQKQLQVYIASNTSNNSANKSMKMLLMITQSLLMGNGHSTHNMAIVSPAASTKGKLM